MRNPTSGGGAAPDVHGFPQMDTARGGTRYYLAGSFGGYSTLSTFTFNGAAMNTVPVVFARDTTLVGLHIYVTGAVGGTHVRLGIYDAIDDTSDLYPNALILDAGEVSTAAGGQKNLVINQTLEGGKLYWLAGVSDGVPNIQSPNPFNLWPLLGWSSTMNGYGGSSWYATQAYGALPATFPTVGSAISTSGWVPGIFYSMA